MIANGMIPLEQCQLMNRILYFVTLMIGIGRFMNTTRAVHRKEQCTVEHSHPAMDPWKRLRIRIWLRDPPRRGGWTEQTIVALL